MIADRYPFEIKKVGGGYQFFTKKRFHSFVKKATLSKNQKRLTRSALETLSIIAYRQPITKAEMEFIRGVNCDYAVQKLLDKKLVSIVGRSEAPGRPLLYSTSPFFMQYFGLGDIGDLPKLKEFEELAEEHQGVVSSASGRIESKRRWQRTGNQNSKKGPFWKEMMSEKASRNLKKKRVTKSKSNPANLKVTKQNSEGGHKPKVDTLVRLNRYIAQAGICSRREADTLISRGLIKVNGKVVTELGTKIVPSNDRVEYDGKVLRAQNLVYILLNKPKNMITTTKDPHGRKTVLDAVAGVTDERLYPVGRLDRNTTGLLLLTNDGEMAKKLTHPSHRVKKVYAVRLNKPFDENDFSKLTEGIELDDGFATVDKIGYSIGKGPEEVGVEIHSGKNRIVRRMFEAIGYQVVALDRTMMGPLTKKNVPRGKYRVLTDKEVKFLKMM